MRQFRALLLALAGSAMLFLIGDRDPIHAQDILIDASGSGWENAYVAETWTPIRLGVTSPTDLPSATVEIAVSQRPPVPPGTQPSQYPYATYQRDVALQANRPLNVEI